MADIDDDVTNMALSPEAIRDNLKIMGRIIKSNRYPIVLTCFLSFFVLFTLEFSFGLYLILLNIQIVGNVGFSELTTFFDDPCYTVPLVATLYGLFGLCLCISFLTLTAVKWRDHDRLKAERLGLRLPTDDKSKLHRVEGGTRLRRTNSVDSQEDDVVELNDDEVLDFHNADSEQTPEAKTEKDWFTKSVHCCFKTVGVNSVEQLDFQSLCSCNINCVMIWTEGVGSCCMLPWFVMLIVTSWSLSIGKFLIDGNSTSPCVNQSDIHNETLVESYKDKMNTSLICSSILIISNWIVFGIAAIIGITRAIYFKLKTKTGS